MNTAKDQRRRFDPTDIKSNWEALKALSHYHFDPRGQDRPEDVIQYLGHLEPTWMADLPEIMENSRPTSWASRSGPNGEGRPGKALAAEEYDLVSNGMSRDMIIGNLNYDIPESLQRISNAFALENCFSRVHVQQPGQLFNLHIDKLYGVAPDDPDSVMRISVQLTDWQPGQFWEYGNYHWNQWRAGNVTAFDWQNMPHSTANAGYYPRVTFQITGIRTAATVDFLASLPK